MDVAKMGNELMYIENKKDGINDEQLYQFIEKLIDSFSARLKNVLILPPDFSRKHSGGGVITAIFYHLLKTRYNVDIMPALGTHSPMLEEELIEMFGSEIPLSKFLIHDWYNDTIKIGEIPSDYVENVSEGIMKESIKVEINEKLVSGEYDLILSIGQVLPHEVVGMSNYTKNILVGCGGNEIISKSHFVGAVYGMERYIGEDHSPVRKIYDFAEEHILKKLPIHYVLTVNSTEIEKSTAMTRIHGIYSGKERNTLEKAVTLSKDLNITKLKSRLGKVVVYLDEKEFKTTWVGCKAIYRTRMIIKDGGELVIIAPGLKKFGENNLSDQIIRKYGYLGTKKILELTRENQDLKENLSVAAHLIHGSSNDRFKITVATQDNLKSDIEKVNFNYISLEKAIDIYDPLSLTNGYNITSDGNEYYFIGNPATGLWRKN